MGRETTLEKVLAEGSGTLADTISRLFNDGAVIDGRWRILGLVGKGGNGEIYRVKNEVNGVIGALKVPLTGDSHLRERFLRELDVLQMIAANSSMAAARHLPRLVDRGMASEANVPYFVIEFLQPLVQPTNDAGVRRLVLGVCDAVRELHENGYLHRDIKRANLMQRTNGDVVLIDFALAGRVEDFENPNAERLSLTQGHVVGVGTPGSSAPEQSYGQASIKSDVFALGSLANDFFCGQPPAGWNLIIQKAINPKPEYRTGDVDEFVSAIRSRERFGKIRLLFVLLMVVAVCVWGVFYMLPASPDPVVVPQKTSALDRVKTGVKTAYEHAAGRVRGVFTSGEGNAKHFDISKYKILNNLREMGLREKFLKWLDESDLRAEWDAAKVLKTTDPLFKKCRKSAQSELGLDDEKFEQLIRNSPIDEN